MTFGKAVLNIGVDKWNVLAEIANEKDNTSEEHKNEEEWNVNISSDSWNSEGGDYEYDADGSHERDGQDDWDYCLNNG